MKITDIKINILGIDFRNAILVQIETDEGITGISETVMKRRSLTIRQSILDYKQYLIGKDPTAIEDHWEKMYRDSFWVGGALQATAISAIDCALWDILAKRCGLPVFKILGGPTRTRIPVYCHCPAGKTPEEFASHVKICIDRGYNVIKTTLPLFYGFENGQNSGGAYSGTHGTVPRDWKETEFLSPGIFKRIREFFVAAREVGGPELTLALDCHGRLGLKAAIRLCRALEDLDLLFIEEPVPPENLEVLRILHRESPIPIAAGERWATIYGVRPFLENQAVDILQCDLVNAGGITAMKRIAALAEAHYVSMAPHNPNGPVATLMNMHYAAAIPNFLILETIGSQADERIFSDVMKTPLRREGGELVLPCCVEGFGIELNEESFTRYPFYPFNGYR